MNELQHLPFIATLSGAETKQVARKNYLDIITTDLEVPSLLSLNAQEHCVCSESVQAFTFVTFPKSTEQITGHTFEVKTGCKELQGNK